MLFVSVLSEAASSVLLWMNKITPNLARIYYHAWLRRGLQQESSNLRRLVSACLRFKEHIQNNLPRDFLTTEQFVELRRELASANGHSGEDAQPADDLPSGTEEITDPAKVPARRAWGCHASLFGDNFVCSRGVPVVLLHISAVWLTW